MHMGLPEGGLVKYKPLCLPYGPLNIFVGGGVKYKPLHTLSGPLNILVYIIFHLV